MSAPLSQKEYLRKYLSGNAASTKKKKKKKPKPIGQGMKIIDDDVDISKMRALENDEMDVFGDPEDAPLVVGIIDERPEELRFTTKKWKIVNQNDGIDSTTTIEQMKGPKGSGDDGSDSDLSPPRINNSADSDLSPEREQNKTNKENIKKENRDDSDLSPERQTSKPKKSKKNYDSDLSPERQTSKSSQSKRKYDSDLSPPRKHKNQESSSKRNDKKRAKKDSDSDLSPERSTNAKPKTNYNDFDLSPMRDGNVKKNSNYDNKNRRYKNSPPRKRERGNERKSRWDNDNPRNHDDSFDKNQDNYNRRNERYDKDSKRDYRENDRRNNGDFDRNGRNNANNREKAGSSKKSDKTLDGKTAGLQGAQQLKDESDKIRRKEDEMFSKLSDEYTGRNAQTIKRDIRRGKKHETEAEKQEQRERELRQKELEAKYSKWGKGLKQAEEQETRLKEYVHESSKPLARYKDDQDLEQELKGRERMGDPMLEYMRKKEREKGGQGETVESRPIYQGAYPINRFDIRPGHRWDGVDRSSGYEKNYFEAKNSKKAQEEEIYKWSTEDM